MSESTIFNDQAKRARRLACSGVDRLTFERLHTAAAEYERLAGLCCDFDLNDPPETHAQED
jgi:hypothetical protein